MSLTSSQRSAAEILQQPLLTHTGKYIDKLAATIIERGGGYMEGVLWDAHEKWKVVPRDTIRVREMRASTYATEFRMAGMPMMELMSRFGSLLERIIISELKQFLNQYVTILLTTRYMLIVF